MTRNRLLVAIAVLLTLIIWMLLYWEPTRMIGREAAQGHSMLELASKPTGGDFTLAASGGAVHLGDLRGRIVLIYFGYTACPDVCPTNLFLIAKALDALSEAERAHVQVLFISVDPQRDDVQRLADYVDYFHPNILGITGSAEQVAEVAALYGAAYRRIDTETAMGYLVDHSAYTYVIDASGKLVQTLDHATAPDEIVKTLRELLVETAPEAAR